MGTHTHPTPLHTHVQPHRFAWTEKLFTLLSSTAWLDFYWWTHWHTGSYNMHALWSLVSCGPYSNCWHHTHIHGEWRVPWPRKIIKIEFNETSQAEVMSSGHSQTRLFTPSGSILTPNPFIFPCLLLTKPSPPAPHFTTSDSSSRHSLVWPQRLCSPAFPPESHTPRQQGPGAHWASPIDSRWWVSHPAHGLIPIWEELGPRLLFHGYVIGVPPPAIVPGDKPLIPQPNSGLLNQVVVLDWK